jgi:putative copper export protein
VNPYVAARILHLLAMAVWVGGTVFLVAVAVPFARSFGPEGSTAVAVSIGRRFRPVAWSALLTLVATGFYMATETGLLTSPTADGRLLRIKIGIVLVVLALAAVHDFVLGPRVELEPSVRRPLLVLARINGVLTLVVPIVGILLAH